MPQAAPIIVAAALKTVTMSALAKAAIMIAVSFVAQSMTKKPKQGQGSGFDSIKSQGATQTARLAVDTRKIVYGEARVSGNLVYVKVTDENKYIHMIITLAGHEVEEIGEVFLNDVSIPIDSLDGDGLVTDGRYEGLVRIRKFNGTTTQTADPDLINEVSELDSNFRLRGVAYLYARCEWDRDVFPSGIPNFSAWVRGKKIYDPRSDSSQYSTNVALIARDFLTETDDGFGMSVDSSDIDDTSITSAANLCDEYVTVQNVDHSFTAVDTTSNIVTLNGDRLKFQTGDKINLIGGTIGGLSTSTDYYCIAYQRKDSPRIQFATTLANALAGTAINLTSGTTGTIRKVGEPRYHGGSMFDTASSWKDTMGEILTGLAGQAVYAGGKWSILGGEYRTPTIAFDEDDLAGAIEVTTKQSASERFNAVQGVYISPLNDDNPADYPQVSNSTYETEDGRSIIRDLDLPLTTRPHTAMRIAKIALEQMRQEIIFTAQFKLTAFKVKVGDVFYFTFDRYGWINKEFEVMEWAASPHDGSPLTVTMTCRETSSSVYDWNNGEETRVDPAPNTSLPSPWTVQVVGGFSLDSINVETKLNDRVFAVVASWDAHPQQSVLSGGGYEIEFKESSKSSSEYRSAARVDGTVTNQEIVGLKPDIEYDLRIFAFSSIGVRSQPTIITNFIVGNTVTTDTEDWENELLARDGDDWESDTLTSEDWEA